ncbi:MAG: hypothetical protein NTU44_08945, partial [Bacteroidetes bacterium]|nr:hypothetical protein [Bacteroidota bacterium]
SSQDRSFTQPFNQYGVSPTYKWITIHAGYRNIFFSPYTLAGATIYGCGIELHPGTFRFGAIYGRLQKAVEEDTTNQQCQPAYKRTGYSIKLGLGTDLYFIDLIFLKASDDASSLTREPVKYMISPQENEVVGLTGHFQLSKKIIFQFDGAGSVYTNDTRALELKGKKQEKYGSLIKIRVSTQLLTAGQASLVYNDRNFGLKIQYKRVDPDYKSMGAYYFQGDLESYTVEPNFRFFKQKLRLGGSIGLQHDNILKQKLVTTDRTIGSVNLSFSPVQQYGIDISYANYGIAQKAGIRPVNDTVKIAQANQNINVMNRLSFTNKIRVINIILITSYQNLTDLNPYTANYTENTVIYCSLNFSVTLLSSGMTLNAGMIGNNNDFTGTRLQMLGPSAGISREIIKKMLSGNLNTSYLVNRVGGKSSGGVVNGNLGLNFRPFKKHSLNLNINLINNRLTTDKSQSFTEFRFNLGYHFYLK